MMRLRIPSIIKPVLALPLYLLVMPMAMVVLGVPVGFVAVVGRLVLHMHVEFLR